MRLGLISFGGPAGQISLLHGELVEKQRWLSERRYLHALNYCMLLPGPEATQLATYLGFLMHGVPGGLIAGGLFLLPSVVVLLALSTVYALWGQLPLLVSIFWALKPAVLAVVVVAAWRLGRRTLDTPLLTAIAGAAFLALTVLGVPYPLLIVGAAVTGWLAGAIRPDLLHSRNRAEPARHPGPGRVPSEGRDDTFIHGDTTPTPLHARFCRRRLAVTLLIWGLALLMPLAGLTVWAGGPASTLATMARFFTRVALVSFGGAYAVLPYVAQGAVDTHGWLSAAQMVDGLALGETTPGPLIMVVAFVGFLGGWNTGVFGPPGTWHGALATTLVTVWFTFLPSFGFILGGAPLVEATREDLRLGAPLTAITAAVVGVIGSLAVLLGGPVLVPEGGFDATALTLTLVALVLLVRRRLSVVQLIGAAALVGLIRHLLLPP